MTSPNQLCDLLLFVCSKMADETNLSSKLPVADSLFVLRFYGPVNPMGHVERGQFT